MTKVIFIISLRSVCGRPAHWWLTLLAAGGDTWGITGRTFALLYLLGAVVVVAGVILWRRAIAAGPVDRPGRLNPFEMAYLAGGPSLAIISALAALRSTGSVGAGPGGKLATTAQTPAVTAELDGAVYSAAERQVAQRALADDPMVSAALERIRTASVSVGGAHSRQPAVPYAPQHSYTSPAGPRDRNKDRDRIRRTCSRTKHLLPRSRS
ncbi:MAG TPA: TIGR04222 domain-containing membrane protein [Micromonosporaceae bacterium]|nr:TIGR04222 domain-containing membrane protein [Micromonosporaceae bacterium]